MNAYELTKDRADILADELLAYHHKGVCGRAAKMLRQQADRIAELEKDLEGCEYFLEKQQSAEPVAWMFERDGAYMCFKHIDGVSFETGTPLYTTPQIKPIAWMQMHYKDNIPTKFSPVKVWEDDIPLYTTPQTKPLSDEEIEYYEHLIAKLFNVSIQQKVIGLDRIIRAIEERHGIK